MPRAKKTAAVAEETAQVTVENTEDITNVTEEVAKDELESAKASAAIDEEEVLKEDAEISKDSLTEKEAEEFEKEAEYFDAFARRHITLPGKKAQRALFREEEVIIGDENNEIQTLSSLKKQEYGMLSDSARTKKPKVLYGRMDGVEEIEIGNGIRVPIAICHLITDRRANINTKDELKSGLYKIKIPAPMFFFYDVSKYQGDKDKYITLKKMMDLRIGSIVEFVVYDINPGDMDVLASRIRAMQILSYDYYLGPKKQIKPGVKAKGYVTSVTSNGCIVDVFGAECFIRNQDIAWKYVQSALNEKDIVSVGKAVPVRIKSVSKNVTEVYGNTIPYIEIEGTIKDAKENPNKILYDKYTMGQKYRGTVGYRLMSGRYFVNLGSEADGIDGERAVCICDPPNVALGSLPRYGQNCCVAIMEKVDKTHRITGIFTYLEP